MGNYLLRITTISPDAGTKHTIIEYKDMTREEVLCEADRLGEVLSNNNFVETGIYGLYWRHKRDYKNQVWIGIFDVDNTLAWVGDSWQHTEYDLSTLTQQTSNLLA